MLRPNSQWPFDPDLLDRRVIEIALQRAEAWRTSSRTSLSMIRSADATDTAATSTPPVPPRRVGPVTRGSHRGSDDNTESPKGQLGSTAGYPQDLFSALGDARLGDLHR